MIKNIRDIYNVLSPEANRSDGYQLHRRAVFGAKALAIGLFADAISLMRVAESFTGINPNNAVTGNTILTLGSLAITYFGYDRLSNAADDYATLLALGPEQPQE